jgi:hypothetical protein
MSIGQSKHRRKFIDSLPRSLPLVQRAAPSRVQVKPSAGADSMRTLFGLLDLLRKHPVQDVERACDLALSAGTTRLRFVRTFLTAKAPSLTTDHRIIAPIDTYSTHFTTLIQGELQLDQ